MSKIYALYKGEECLAIGTIKEIAEQTNLKPRTVYFYSMPVWKKRHKNLDNARVLIKSEE